MNLKNESELGDIYISFTYRPISFYRQNLKFRWKQEIKPNQKNEFEDESGLGDIYISFTYRPISFYRQNLKFTCKLCAPVRLEVKGVSHGTLPPLTKN